MAPAPARLSSVVVPALIAGLAILAAYTDQTRPSATPTELPLSPRAAAVVTEEHLGTAFAGYQPARTFWLPESTTSVALHYRATPVRGSFTVLVGVGACRSRRRRGRLVRPPRVPLWSARRPAA